jgi:[acyl-carrier-protein] S-malonyltransferase
VRLAAARGAAMERAAQASPGGMIAFGDEVDVGPVPGLELAARNGPSQRVYSGPERAIRAAARVSGGRRLDVSGAWHSRAMAAAEPALREALASIAPAAGTSALATCLDGRKLEPAEVPDLVAQLTRPVAWSEVMATLAAEGVTDAVCLAPGRTSRGLLRDGLGPAVRLHVVESEADCDRLLATLRPEQRGTPS